MMTAQTIMLNLPEALYQQLRSRAIQHKRSVADEVLNVLSESVPVDNKLPQDVEQAPSSLDALDDYALWSLARSRMSPEAAEHLKDLNLKQQREGLSGVESKESELLLGQYERTMLIRARAAVLLKERGQDVSSLLTAP